MCEHLERWLERTYWSLREKTVARSDILEFIKEYPEYIAPGTVYSWPEILERARARGK